MPSCSTILFVEPDKVISFGNLDAKLLPFTRILTFRRILLKEDKSNLI